MQLEQNKKRKFCRQGSELQRGDVEGPFGFIGFDLMMIECLFFVFL